MSDLEMTLHIQTIEPSPLPERGGRLQFRTESGSLYEVDFAARRWVRLAHSAESVMVRSADGELTGITEIRVGSPVRLFGPSLDPARDFRMIETMPVSEIVLDED